MFERSSATGERRVATRQAVVYRLDLELADGSVGCLMDLSATGMRVRFKQALDVGSTQELHLDFPRWLELGGGLDVRGRFVWMRSTEQGGTEAGFAFDGLSRKESSLLEVLLQRLGEALAEDQAART